MNDIPDDPLKLLYKARDILLETYECPLCEKHVERAIVLLEAKRKNNEEKEFEPIKINE